MYSLIRATPCFSGGYRQSIKLFSPLASPDNPSVVLRPARAGGGGGGGVIPPDIQARRRRCCREKRNPLCLYLEN